MEIDRRIREGAYPNAETMAESLEVSRRVIFNDRSFMIYRLGAPIEFDRERGGWFYTDKTWSLPGIYVTQGELMAFFLWRSRSATSGPTLSHLSALPWIRSPKR